MNADQILGAWNVLRNRYQDRDLRYKACWNAYNGDFDKITPQYAGVSKLKDIRVPKEHNIQVWNMVFPFVEAKRALTSRLPAIEVPAPKMGDPLAAQFAEKQERLHYCLYDSSQMKKKHAKAAFNAALWNSTTWFVRWDKEKDLPVVTVRKPGETYPVFKRSGDEMAYSLFVFKMDEDEIVEQYPEAKGLLTRERKKLSYSSAREIEVIEYVDDKQYGLVINGDYASLVQGGMTELGFCPVIITPGSYVEGDDGEFFPPSGIEQVVAINDLLNRFQTKWHDALEETLRPGAILKGPNVENKVWDQGPGAINYLDVDEEYQPPQYPNLPTEVFIHIQRMEQIMRTIANVPESASGQSDASIITGQAVKRLQGVMTAVAGETMDSFTNGLAKCNEWTFRMMEKYRPDKEYTLYSTDSITPMSRPGKKENIQVTVVPRETINKYYRSRLIYSPLGMDTGLALTLGMQLVDADVVSRRWLRNQISGLGDAEGMEAEIEEEKRKRLQLEVDLQALAYERMQAAQAQAQGQAAGGVQEGAAPMSAPGPGVAPPPEGGPASTAPQPQQIGPTTVMPGGQPSMMGMGEPITGRENFPIPYTPLKPFNEALQGLSNQGIGAPGGGPAGPGGDLRGEAAPGRTVVKAEEIVAALNEATNKRGEKAATKIRGKVYLLGEIAQRGWTDGEIEIGLTVKSDQQIIVGALPQYAAARRLVFRTLTTVPPDAMLISGGTAAPEPIEAGVS